MKEVMNELFRGNGIDTGSEEGAEMHCQKGNASFLHQIEFDWLDDVLGNKEIQ